VFKTFALTVAALSVAAPALAQQPAASAPAPTRAEIINSLQTNFKGLDSNGDGSLSQTEVAAAETKRLQQRAAQLRAQGEAQFGKLDTNRDGQLSRAEFLAAAPTLPAAGNGATIVKQLDKNNDSKISIDEYRAPVLANFDRADTNKDGTISQAERQAATRR